MSERWARLTECMPMLRAYVRRMTRSGQLLDEVMQETCLRILRAEDVPVEPARFVAWARGVARHVWFAERRKSMPSASELPIDSGIHEVPDARSDPEQRLYASETLARASAGIDAEGAELLVRHYVFEERIVDIAGERAQSPTALRMRLMRLRSTLRAKERR